MTRLVKLYQLDELLMGVFEFKSLGLDLLWKYAVE